MGTIHQQNGPNTTNAVGSLRFGESMPLKTSQPFQNYHQQLASEDHYSRVSGEAGGEQDVFRDTLARYLGFSNEVTHATRAIQTILRFIPFWNKLGWGISLGYGALDARHKAGIAEKSAKADGLSPEAVKHKKNVAMDKTVVFHILASWVTPIAILETIEKVSEKALNAMKVTKGAHAIAIGLKLAAIPFMTKVLDPLVENFLHKYE